MRKLAAIMFTDIVGYTALMGEDESKALEVLQKNREFLKTHIEKYNGEWLKEMGDGTLSSFVSAVDAVNCALEIQHTLREEPELTLRIGLHVGDVIFAKITPCMENGKVAIVNNLKNGIGFGSTEFHVVRFINNNFSNAQKLAHFKGGKNILYIVCIYFRF